MSKAISDGPPPFESLIKLAPSRGREIGCAIAIIVGVGALVVAVIGLGNHQGWWSVGAFSSTDSFIMMGVGGGGGLILLITGAIYAVKDWNMKKELPLEQWGVMVETCVYIRDLPYDFGYEVLPAVPDIELPPIPEGYDPQIYMPVLIPAVSYNQVLGMINVRGLDTLTSYQQYVAQNGDTAIEKPYWVLWHKGGVPESNDLTLEEQRELLQQTGHELPTLIETILCVAQEVRIYGSKGYAMRCDVILDKTHGITIGGGEKRADGKIGVELVFSRPDLPTNHEVGAVIRLIAKESTE